MELRRYLHLLKQRFALVLVCVIVGAAGGYLSTSRVAEYRASAELYVGSLELQANPAQLFQETGLDQILSTYSVMIPSSAIAQKAVADTGVARSAGAVAGETSAGVFPGTNLIIVTVTDRDPLVAQTLANGMSNAFIAQIQSFRPSASAGVGTVPVEPTYVFQDAGLPVVPLSNGMQRKVILGAVFGFLAAVLLVLLLDYLDITVRSPDDLERHLALPILAIIPLQHSQPEWIDLG